MNSNSLSLPKVLILSVLALTVIRCLQPGHEGSQVRKKLEQVHTIQKPDTSGNKEGVMKSCNKPLLESIGFQGFKKPKKQKLGMCPQITDSCCTNDDQLNIYENWVVNLEEEAIKNLFAKHREVYQKLTSLLYRVSSRAQMTTDFLAKQKTSNCKVLARRVLHFNIGEVGPKLKAALEGMHEFFSKSYKGFYCMICDANMNRFINVKSNKIVMSSDFCRKMTAYSLHVLIYYHVNFTRYLNLVSRFLTNCSVKGVYRDVLVGGEPKITLKRPIARLLQNCKAYRNDENWLEHCVGICKKFSIVKFNDFFAPNLKKYHRYNRFLEKHVVRLEKEAILVKLMQNESMRKKRILAEAVKAPEAPASAPKVPMTKEEEELQAIIAEMAMFRESPVVIKSTEGAIFDLANLSSTIASDGIDVHAIGINSVIDDVLFQKIVHDQRDAQDKKNGITAASKKDENEDQDGVEITRSVIISVVLGYLLLMIK